MQHRIAAKLLSSVIALCFFASMAIASSPSLTLVMPRGVQRGKQHVVTFSGARLNDAQDILYYSPGIKTDKIEPINANSIKVFMTVAPDCRLGEHMVQVRTKSGVSDFRSFYIGALPQVDEKEPNSQFEQPQSIPLNSTVAGVVQSEDVDYFVVEAKKGQRICAEIEGIRLGTFLFDPYVAIMNAKRFELSAEDDTPLVRQDSVASIIAPEDGKYYVQVRESSYGGNGNCRYRLHVGTFPRPRAVYPAGGKKGETLDVKYIGDPSGDIVAKVTVPNKDVLEYGVFAEDPNGISPSHCSFRVCDYGNSMEVEPNNTTKTASPAALPNAFNGIISEPGDIDFFKFTAKKGQNFDVECFARRLRSGLDPVMHIYYGNGKYITSNDDSRGPDSYFRFNCPADGEYIIRVTDHLSRGQADFVYRLELIPVKPSLTLGIPRVARYSQYRQAIFVARGNRFATLMTASRANFGGEIVLEGNDLPQGVKMIAPPMASNLNSMPVVFEAAADAPLSGKLVDFRGRHADPKTGIAGGYRNSADFVRGPNNTILYHGKVDKLPIVVVDELPYTLEIVQPKVPLVRRGSMALKVIAKRKEGFTAAINVQFPFRPPGVGAPPSVNIPANKSEVVIPLNANGGAQIRKWPVYAIGSSNVNGSAWVASQMAELEIAEPFVSFEMQRSSCEQGEEALVYCKVNQTKPFEGEAKVELLNIPPKTTTEVININKETKEITFKVKTDKTSPPGSHKNIFCRLTIMQNGEPIVASVGGTDLQIDKPLPAPVKPAPKPKAAPKKVVAQKKPQPKKKKPLSRLEKLRLAAKQAKEAAAAAQNEK